MSLPLEIVVTANTSGVTPGLKSVQTELAATAIAAQKADSSLKTFGNELSAQGTIHSEATGKLSKTALAIEHLTSVDDIAAHSIRGFGREILHILPSLAFGGLIAVASLAIEALGEALFGTEKISKATEEQNKKLAESYKSIVDSTAKEASQIGVIVTQLTTENLTRRQRQSLIEELQHQAPAYFEVLNKEKATIGEITAAYNSYVASLNNVIQAKLIEKQLEDVTSKILDLEKKRVTTTNEQVDINGKLIRTTQGVIQSNEDALAGESEYQRLSSGRGQLSRKENQDLQNLILTRKSLNDELAKIQPIKISSTSAGNPFEIDLQAIQKEYERAQVFLHNTYDANLKDATQNSIVIEDALLNAHIKFLTEKLALDKKYNKDNFSDFEELIGLQEELEKRNAEFRKGLNKDNVVQPLQDITAKLPDSLDPNKLAVSKINPKAIVFLTDEAIRAIQALEKLNEQLAEAGKLATSVLDPAFQALFTTILDGTGNAFQAFGEALNQILKQIAVTLLKAVALGAILAAITGKPFDIGTIISSTIKGFAGGTRNFEGGLALVGEKGPELVALPQGANVIPNNQISGYTGGTQVFIPSVTIKGPDLVLAFNRQVAINSRNG